MQNLRAPLTDPEAWAIAEAEKKLRRAGLRACRMSLFRKSIDARRKNAIVYLCSVAAELEGFPESFPDEKTLAALDAIPLVRADFSPLPGASLLAAPPAVVGFGPCGMFAALALAERGYRPMVFERGGDVAFRERAVARFYQECLLSPECNIQFGAGGAGTFSDGKLVTRKNDRFCAYVLERLVEFGAPRDILVNARPHIGSDLLKRIVTNFASHIEALGGKIHYHTRVEAFRPMSGGGIALRVGPDEIPAGAVVLAVGHSARDTYEYLYKNRFALQPKAFSVGVRIEHRAEAINRAMYGEAAELLPPAEYNLSRVIGERGVYSFCMCPGGEVVAAASEEGGVVTNGMSLHARDGVNSNAALAVSVLPSDYGEDPMAAVAFQRNLERAAFAAGGGRYAAPVSTVGDFLAGRSGSEPTAVLPTYMGGAYALADLSALLPPFVTSMLRTGIMDFGGKIRGFDDPRALLTGVETRTSAPLRILRGESREAGALPGLYPCGEGAGYAGGIMSAAVDGLRTAAAIIERYCPLEKTDS